MISREKRDNIRISLPPLTRPPRHNQMPKSILNSDILIENLLPIRFDAAELSGDHLIEDSDYRLLGEVFLLVSRAVGIRDGGIFIVRVGPGLGFGEVAVGAEALPVEGVRGFVRPECRIVLAVAEDDHVADAGVGVGVAVRVAGEACGIEPLDAVWL
jgi:hypothetical protein